VALIRDLAVAGLFAALTTGAVRGEDPVAALARRIDQGSAHLEFGRTYGYLPALLEELHVPVESQMAVFSKTSLQGMIIQPSNPRVLYFNDSVAVGWVRGGFIELAAQNPGHGIAFYVLLQRPDEHITRRQDCVKCHKSSALLLRSVTSAPSGVPSGDTDTNVDGRTPFSGLWGGWFVTGKVVPAGHSGNAVFEKAERHRIELAPDPKTSLTPSSDIVALMVFAHQVRMMNLLANPDNVNELVDSLLFADAAPFPGKVAGESGFTENFTAGGPKDSKGRSLRDLDLERHLVRYPCSYMIYSDAFDALPAPIKQAVYKRMWGILSGEVTGPLYAHLSREARRAVVEILRDTRSGLPDYFQQPIR
jgi:hypothetical protein